MTDKKRLKKLYNPNSIVALARYLDVTTQTVHGWRRGAYRKDGETIENKKSIKKYSLIKLGWEKVCEDALLDG